MASLKWGIISAGKISTSFAKAITTLPETEHKMVAIAARDLQRAEEFAKTFSIEKAYGDYESIAKDTNIDVVYIGNLHPQHFEVAKMMLEHGKHILCEKPMTMNERQTKKLIEIARHEGKFLMEAVWSRCFPAYAKLKELIAAGEIGDVKFVSVFFGKKINHIDRLNRKDLGGGALLDIGCYTLQFQQWVFGMQEPLKLACAGHLNKWETDESASVILTYPGGKTAVLSSHVCVDFNNEALVIGEKGTIRIPYFWRPTTLITPSGVHELKLPETQYDEMRPAMMAYEVQEVGKCIKEGLLESPKITHAESIQLARLMDQIRKEVGVVYKEDFEEC